MKFMLEAAAEARLALEKNEVPVGCVVVHGGEIIGRGHNENKTKSCVIYHAEIAAIMQASKAVGDWRLEDCTLYVTIEPCPMCAGAIVQSRIPRVVFGAKNPKAGCSGSILDILNEPRFNHQVAVTEGVMAEECGALMSEFFKRMRGATHGNSIYLRENF